MSVSHFWYKEVILGMITPEIWEHKEDSGLERLSRISKLSIGYDDNVIGHAWVAESRRLGTWIIHLRISKGSREPHGIMCWKFLMPYLTLKWGSDMVCKWERLGLPQMGVLQWVGVLNFVFFSGLAPYHYGNFHVGSDSRVRARPSKVQFAWLWKETQQCILHVTAELYRG